MFFCLMGPEAFFSLLHMPGGFYHSLSCFEVRMPQAYSFLLIFEGCVYMFLTFYSFDTVPFIFIFTEAC
jgi:hypothetical protein